MEDEYTQITVVLILMVSQGSRITWHNKNPNPPSIPSLYPSSPLSLLLCSRTRSSGSAMKLGKKGKDVESFVDKLVAEGQREWMWPNLTYELGLCFRYMYSCEHLNYTGLNFSEEGLSEHLIKITHGFIVHTCHNNWVYAWHTEGLVLSHALKCRYWFSSNIAYIVLLRTISDALHVLGPGSMIAGVPQLQYWQQILHARLPLGRALLMCGSGLWAVYIHNLKRAIFLPCVCCFFLLFFWNRFANWTFYKFRPAKLNKIKVTISMLGKSMSSHLVLERGRVWCMGTSEG